MTDVCSQMSSIDWFAVFDKMFWRLLIVYLLIHIIRKMNKKK